jgi:DNA helicase-2/ATP-dependent DNA helicase PcrA
MDWQKMSNPVNNLEQKIRDRHSGDEKQLEVVFSPSSRLLVEAPAGYGKTKTMISKIAYMFATQQIPYPKRLLALTFSVNAAYKIKKDVAQQIPELLKNMDLVININEKISVSNYHGFCRNVLKKHGHILHEALLAIDILETIDDSDAKKLMELIGTLTYDEAVLMSDYSKAVKEINSSFVKDNLDRYCEIIIKKLLTSKTVTFNGILTLTIKLFTNFSAIKDFYNKYFAAILVDEYQDTNILSFWLLTLIITDKTKIIFLGDSLQRIYGFIGAVPNLLSQSQKRFNLTRITLDKNYRFASNEEMLRLDLNIRKNAENPFSPIISENAKVNFENYDNQNNEANGILNKVRSLMEVDGASKISILVKQRGRNVEKIIEIFDGKIAYFYGLFTDEDPEYVKFHRKCSAKFQELISQNAQVIKKLAHEHISEINRLYSNKNNQIHQALLALLSIFWERVFLEFSFLGNEDKIFFIRDTFEHNGLKQYIEFVNANAIFSTVHAAKGLEWDYVIIPDMEQDSFPNYFGLCGNCLSKNTCNLKVTKENEQKFLEELSVFYVAVTRAKKQVFFSASTTQLDKFDNQRRKNRSCFLSLPGIETL